MARRPRKRALDEEFAALPDEEQEAIAEALWRAAERDGRIVPLISFAGTPSAESLEFFGKKLARLEAGYRAGNLPSAIEAMHFCYGAKLAWPEWLAQIAMDYTMASFRQSKREGVGRFVTDRESMRCYHMAALWLRWRDAEKERWAQLTRKQKQALGPDAKRLAGRYPLTESGAFDAAAAELNELNEADAKVTAGSVRKAYFEVKRALKTGRADRLLAAAKTRP